MPYIEGSGREQQVLFPEVLDDYVGADNPVRFLDAFVDTLDLATLGFQRATPSATGRPAYDPADLLRLHLYGYLYRLRSSRKLEQETHRNIEVIWLLRKLRPDFKTIADFRKAHPAALKGVCREFTLLCKKLELFGGDLIAIDGSKFRASNNSDRNCSRAALDELLTAIDARIAAYVERLDAHDAAEARDASGSVTGTELQTKLTALRARRTTYRELVAELTASGDTQISQTDPDSRSMRGGTGVAVCYNVQTAVDAKHTLIVAHDVVNAPTDQAQLSPMAIAAQAILCAPDLQVVADRGYYSGPEILACLDAGITPTVPKPHTSANAKLGLFTKEHFQYDAATDTYACPAGSVMTYGYSTVERGRGMRYYRTPACTHCTIKARCTRSPGARRITRWEQEAVLDAMEQRHAAHPERSAQRKAIVEHPFGTMKRWMDHGYFLCRGLTNVGAEFSLTVFASNLKRALTIVGVPRLIAALA